MVIATFLQKYKDAGLSFFPVPLGKKEANIKWQVYQKRQPTDEEIKQWANGNKTNIAVVCGAVSDNLTVLDCDSIDLFNELAKIICQKTGVPDIQNFTTISQTGKGMHIWLKTKDPIKSQKFPKLDIKGEGGYIIAPPSLHPNGVEYKFVNETPIQRIELLTDIGIDTKKPEPELSKGEQQNWISEALQGVPEGMRDDTCARLAGYFLKSNPPDVVKELLYSFALKCEQPPKAETSFTARDVDKIVNSLKAHHHILSEKRDIALSKPTIQETIGGYSFLWQNEELKIQVSRTRLHKDGRLTGEILIQTTREADTPILYPQTQLNFSSPRTRRELANNLKEKYPSWDWTQLIDQLSYLLQERIQLGEPAQELWTYENIKAPEYLLEPLLIKGVPTTIYGEKGVAKSTLALVISTCLLLPWDDNPLGWIAPKESTVALILDWEAEGDIIQWMAKKLQEGMNLPPFPVFYRRCIIPLADDLEQIQRHIKKVNAQVIIIDSLGAAAGGDLKDAQIALNFFQALRQLKTTTLVIAQTTKDPETKKKRIFGSVYYEYYSRSIFELRKAETEPSEDSISIGLFHRWSNLTPIKPPMGIKLCFSTEDKMTIEREDVRSIGAFIEAMTTQARILEILKEGAMTNREIAEALELTGSATNMALSRLKKKDKIVKTQVGNQTGWGLLYQE